MPIDFELQQGLFCITLIARPNLDPIQILSGFYPVPIRILYRLYPDSVRILSNYIQSEYMFDEIHLKFG